MIDEHIVVNSSITAASVLFVFSIVCLTLYTSSSNTYVTNTKQSEDKMTILNEAFKTFLGSKWPIVLLIIIILIGLILYFLYLASSKEVITLNINDNTAHILTITFGIFVCVFTIWVAVLAFKQYLNNKRQQQNGNIPNYIPNINQQTEDNKLLTVVGLGLCVFVILILAIWYIFFRKK